MFDEIAQCRAQKDPNGPHLPVVVVVPCFRQASFLEGALASIAAQTRPPERVVVVAGDASSGAKAKDLSRQAWPFYLQAIRDPGAGKAIALNAALGHPCSLPFQPFFQVLDADDELVPTALEREWAVVEASPLVDVVTIGMQEFGLGANTWDPPPWNPFSILRGSPAPYSALIRRGVWSILRGFSAGEVHEDWGFWLRVAQSDAKVLHVPERLLRYRVHEASQMAGNHAFGDLQITAALTRIAAMSAAPVVTTFDFVDYALRGRSIDEARVRTMPPSGWAALEARAQTLHDAGWMPDPGLDAVLRITPRRALRLAERTIVVSLRRRSDRRARFAAEAERASLLDWRFFDAIDGPAMALQTTRGKTLRRASTTALPMTPGEIGCFLSHLVAIETALHEGAGSIALLEDDVSFVPDAIERWARLAEEEAPVKLLMPPPGSLFADADPDAVYRIEAGSLPERPATELGSPAWGTFGYVLDRRAMERFVALADEVGIGVADWFLCRVYAPLGAAGLAIVTHAADTFDTDVADVPEPEEHPATAGPPRILFQCGAIALEGPMAGGSEFAVRALAEALADRGAEVVVQSGKARPSVRIAYTQGLPPGDWTLAVAWRNALPALPKAQRTALWTHDLVPGDAHALRHADGTRAIDRLWAVSDWHRAVLEKRLGLDLPVLVVPNAPVARPAPHVERHPLRAICTVQPYRAWMPLLDLWPEVRKEVPGAELLLVGHFDGWMAAFGHDPVHVYAQYALADRLRRGVEGVSVVARTRPDQLGALLSAAGVWVYPTLWPETSCMAALDAMACGCRVVASHAGALGETIGKGGVLLEGDPHTPRVRGAFVRAIVHALRAPEEGAHPRLSREGVTRHVGERFSWDRSADRVLSSL
jgi:GR25 family glycosyltransferase involved in LPS biosynthesis/glycosyltransferase involved in cell wall biosynthesis